MPIYEYECGDCQQLFEHWQKDYNPQDHIDCPICKGDAKKVMSNTSFILKGGGWYATEYGNRKDSTAGGNADSPVPITSSASEVASGSVSTDAKPADVKTAADTKAPASDKVAAPASKPVATTPAANTSSSSATKAASAHAS